jgi:hypothetical protein
MPGLFTMPIVVAGSNFLSCSACLLPYSWITAIRNGDIDGNPATDRDSTWLPTLTTPMHPEYLCAHCIREAKSIATEPANATSSIPPARERRRHLKPEREGIPRATVGSEAFGARPRCSAPPRQGIIKLEDPGRRHSTDGSRKLHAG